MDKIITVDELIPVIKELKKSHNAKSFEIIYNSGNTDLTVVFPIEEEKDLEFTMELYDFFNRYNRKRWNEIMEYCEGYHINEMYGSYEEGNVFDTACFKFFDTKERFQYIHFDLKSE